MSKLQKRLEDTIIVKTKSGEQNDRSTDEIKSMFSTEKISQTTTVPDNAYGVYTIHDEYLDTSFVGIYNWLSKSATNDQRQSLSSEDFSDGTSVSNLSANSASFALLRTNPKLTGNIKVVIDSKSNIYIDTFKVNDSLAKRKYRKVPVNYTEYYGNNIMSVFKDITSNDLYDTPSISKNLFTITTDYKEQYCDTYRMGACQNTDTLYSESISLFAPLCVKKTLPDFFMVFRINGQIDESLTDKQKIKYLLTNGTQIKFYDFREGTQLGTYLRTFQDRALKSHGYIYPSRDENNYNIYSGISVDKGVISSAFESTAFSEDTSLATDFDEQTSQIRINKHYTQGFENNRLVAADILNFEFLFNDFESENYSLNTYFGLYLKENDIDNDFYVNMYDDIYGVENIGYYKDGEQVEIPSISNIDKSCIVGFTTDKTVLRTQSDDNMELLREQTTTKGNNILSVSGRYIDQSDTYKAFVSITINNPDEYATQHGEHLRIIARQATTSGYYYNQDYIYEVILSNNSTYSKNKWNLSDDTITYYTHIYDSNVRPTKNIEVHRISISLINSDDTHLSGSDVLKSIYHAFRSFEDATFESISLQDNTITIGVYSAYNAVTNDCEWEFSRITNNIVYESKEKGLNKLADDDNIIAQQITYFGNNVAPLFIMNPMDINSPLYYTDSNKRRNISYTPIDYEILGPRQINAVKFIDIDTNLYEFNSNVVDEDTLKSHTQYYNEQTDKLEDYPQFTIDIVSFDDTDIYDTSFGVNMITSIMHPNLYMVKYKNSTDETTRINLYKPNYLALSIFGILSVKDFDNTILNDVEKDKKLEYVTYESEYIADDYPLLQNQKIKNTIDASTTQQYLNTVYQSGVRTFSTSLIVPHCVKWKGYGNETANEYVLYNNNAKIKTLNNNTSIHDTSIQTVEMHKYITLNKNIRDCLIDGTITINDIVNTYNATNTVIAEDKQNLSFFYNGRKHTISIENNTYINMETYNDYEVYYINSTTCGSSMETELFIDTVDKNMLIVRYLKSYPVSLYDGVSREWSHNMYRHDLFVPEKDILFSADGIIVDNVKVKQTNNIISISSDNCNIYKQGGVLNYIKYNGTNVSDDCTLQKSAKKYTYLTEFSDSSICIIQSDSSSSHYTETKKTLSNERVGLFIKQEGSFIDYTNSTKTFITENNNQDSSSFIKSWFKPSTKDILTFDSSLDLSDSFINIQNGNLLVGDINATTTEYITKYSNDTTYCMPKTESSITKCRTSVGKLSSYDILNNSFSKNMFHEYSANGDTTTHGYKIGILQKTFFNSLVLNVYKNVPLEITSWSNTIKDNNKIYYNITDSLINKILTIPGFANSWKYIHGAFAEDIRNFINKSIIPNLQINYGGEILIQYKDGSTIEFSNRFVETGVAASGISTSIQKSNDKYYAVMQYDTTKTPSGTYYIKFKIK